MLLLSIVLPAAGVGLTMVALPLLGSRRPGEVVVSAVMEAIAVACCIRAMRATRRSFWVLPCIGLGMTLAVLGLAVMYGVGMLLRAD